MNQCTATSTRSGVRCKRAPVNGATVCATHGGRAPQVKAAAAARVAEDKLRQEVIRAAVMGVLPVPETGATLLESVAMMAQVVTFQRAQLAQLDRPSLDALDRFMAHVEKLGRMAKLADDAQLGERRVRLEEAQGALLVGLLERVIRRLDEHVHALTGRRLLDPMDPQVRELVRVELAAIEGGEAA